MIPDQILKKLDSLIPWDIRFLYKRDVPTHCPFGSREGQVGSVNMTILHLPEHEWRKLYSMILLNLGLTLVLVLVALEFCSLLLPALGRKLILGGGNNLFYKPGPG